MVRLPLLESKDVDMAVRFFDRYGFPAVAIARFVPMVRTFISIPAGIERMPVALFAAATGLGSAIWNAAFVVAGYFFGVAGGEALEGFVRIYSVIVAGFGIIAGIGFVVQRMRTRQGSGAPGASAAEDTDADVPATTEGPGDSGVPGPTLER